MEPELRFDVVSCCGDTEENAGERSCPCPFFDMENDTEFCSLNEFYISSPLEIPKDCLLHKVKCILVTKKE